MNVLDIKMKENDAGAEDIRDYLANLLLTLWSEREGFSGKRPFGNSGWEYDLYEALVQAGVVAGKLDEDGYLEEVRGDEADDLIRDTIMKAFGLLDAEGE